MSRWDRSPGRKEVKKLERYGTDRRVCKAAVVIVEERLADCLAGRQVILERTKVIKNVVSLDCHLEWNTGHHLAVLMRTPGEVEQVVTLTHVTK